MAASLLLLQRGTQLSNEEKHGCSGFTGDSSTQLYRGYYIPRCFSGRISEPATVGLFVGGVGE